MVIETPYAGDVELNLRYLRAAVARVFYVDRGWSSGMRQGHVKAVRLGQAREFRTVSGWTG